MEQKQLHLCRICLKIGATHPIFQGDEESCILNKLKICLNEKIENIEGHPRNICEECNEILDTLCTFVKKFKSTNTILQNGLCIKQIKPITEQCNQIKLENVKYEPESDNNLDFSNSDISNEPTELLKSKKRSVKCESLASNKKEQKNKRNTSNGKAAQQRCSKLSKSIIKQKGYETSTEKATVEKSHKEKSSTTPALCHICGEVFQNVGMLCNHRIKKHNKKAKCPHCDKTLVSDYYLMKHIKRIHGGPKDFKCTLCNKAFTFKNELTSHINQVHKKKVVEKKKFSCKLCSKVYNCEKSVIIHERSVHTGERPAVCKVCGSSFFHNEYLLQHMRLHTGETPFKCPVCGRGYAQKGNMKSHMRIHRASELDNDTLSKLKPNLLKFLKP